MKWPFFTSSSCLGLDIQADSFRLVQLKKNRQGFQLERLAKGCLPDAVFSEGKIKQWDLLQAVLQQKVRRLGLEGIETTLVLPANLVRMQHLRLPLGLSQADIYAEIASHAHQDLPHKLETLCIDFVEMATDEAEVDLLFVASRAAYVRQYVECVTQAGLKVKIVEVDIYALHRVVSLLQPLGVKTGTVFALLQLAYASASLSLFNDNECIFYQSFEPSEGADLVLQLKQRLHLYAESTEVLPISQLLICGSPENHAYFAAETWPFTLAFPTSLASLPTLSLTDEPHTDYFIACGAALREMPTW